MPDNIAPFEKVLGAELSELETRRKRIFSATGPGIDPTKSAVDRAFAFRALGIGLSGGGIRSATFNLGILQGLAARGLLPYADYLSTISGGGYIGTWLHGVIRRKCEGNPRLAEEVLDPYGVPGEADDDPVTFLRKYSNYLAPKLGLFSADFWVIFTIWIRNMLLNLLILIPLLASLVAAAIVVAPWLGVGPEWDNGWRTWLGSTALALLFVAVVSSGASLRAIARREHSSKEDPPGKSKTKSPPALTVGCVLLAALAIFYCHWWTPVMKFYVAPAWLFYFVALFALLVTMQASGGFWGCFRATHKWKSLVWFHLLWMPLLGAAVGTLLLCAALSAIGNVGPIYPVIWGPPLIVLVLTATVSFHIGLMGADFLDASREWLARIASLLFIASAAWIAFYSIALYGAFAMAWLGLHYGGTTVVLIAAWAASTVFGVGAGTSPTTGSTDAEAKRGGLGFKELAARIAPTIFAIGLLILVAGGVHYLLGTIETDGYTEPMAAASTNPPVAEAGASLRPLDPGVTAVKVVSQTDENIAMANSWFAGLRPFVNNYQAVLGEEETRGYAELLFAGLMGIALFLPLRFNINEFSLHHFYKNRLVRCYLGAGNAKQRQPNHLTGFDPKDDIGIATLRPGAAKDPYFGPYPIVGTALNLNAGSELAQQERKATSFIFSPLYCGFQPPHSAEDREVAAKPDSRMDLNGYIETEGFFESAGPGIGTAMAISGAAANPNWGYHTSAPVAFLLTVFDVRLGAWVGNPRVKPLRGLFAGLAPSTRPGPLYGLLWLIWELLGQTTGRSKYVNLSDGGHFDNLGLYELIRRRCRYIVIGDGEQDGGLTFESLGGAIRKCRADFGVEIDINVEPIRAADGRAHCVVGTITYPEDDTQPQRPLTPGGRKPADGRARAWLVYFKASLTGDEPEDVKQYHATHIDFPHESTLNQFFTESQFESYRRLGLHIVETAFQNVDTASMTQPPAPESTLPAYQSPEGMFQQLAAVWYPALNLAPGVAVRLNNSYSALMKQLANEPELAFLDEQLAGITASEPAAPVSAEAERKAFFFVLDLIQLMENVWFELGFESAAIRDNPKNGGWIAMFKKWAKAPVVMKTWEVARENFNTLFGAFFDQL
jgi:hypothetical protein